MLVNPRFKKQKSDDTLQLLDLVGQGGIPVEIEPGIFLSNTFSFHYCIENDCEKYYDFGDWDAYGVCDNIEQVKRVYSTWLNDSELKFCVSFVKIVKSEQSEEGGWRWHKWGHYIGDKNPQCEYLYDEGDDIQEIYVYHIYELLD